MKYKGLIFDLDGTLAPSKSAPLPEMQKTLCEALKKYKIAVVSGARFEQFINQLVGHLPCADFTNLLLVPTDGAAIYEFKEGEWVCVEKHSLSESEKSKIKAAISDAMQMFNVPVVSLYGEQIEDRGSQVTFSGLGSRTPLDLKAKWDPEASLRKKMADYIQSKLPEFEVGIGGMTSIDVTRKGIDKEYAVNKILKYWNFDKKEVLFMGDAIFPGGNDEPATRTGVDSKKVSGPEETEKTIQELLK